jgi:hypothetical protein
METMVLLGTYCILVSCRHTISAFTVRTNSLIVSWRARELRPHVPNQDFGWIHQKR